MFKRLLAYVKARKTTLLKEYLKVNKDVEKKHINIIKEFLKQNNQLDIIHSYIKALYESIELVENDILFIVSNPIRFCTEMWDWRILRFIDHETWGNFDKMILQPLMFDMEKNDCNYCDMDVKQWDPYQEQCNISAKESLEAILKSMKEHNKTVLMGQTQLMIVPGYEYRIVDSMVTNFHQPKSTLLLLVSAMIGYKWKEVYQSALNNNYRFLSFGDACMFTK